MRPYFNKTIIAMLIITIIIGQTLPFKFGGWEESVILFTKLGVEPRGRIATGILELIVLIGLRIPHIQKRAIRGVIGLMSGALVFHLLILGRDKLVIGAFISLVCAISLLISTK